MGGEATKSIAKDVLWGGGRSPFSVSYGKMMMWYFITSDALTFSAFLAAYGFSRFKNTTIDIISPATDNILGKEDGHTGFFFIIGARRWSIPKKAVYP